MGNGIKPERYRKLSYTATIKGHVIITVGLNNKT
jgi:hypothetical protein